MSSTGMTFRRFFLAVMFLAGVALGWFARGENDGNVAKNAVMVAEEKTKAVEEARWEKQLRDLEMEKNNLLDKLAVASAKDAIIDRKEKEIEELKAQLSAEKKPPATPPPVDPPKPDEPAKPDPKP